MSYNIDTFKLKKVKLTLPIDIKLNKYADWLKDTIADLNNGTWSVNDGWEGFSMSGKIINSRLEVENIDCSGGGSGNAYEEILKPLFKDYKGDLEVVTVWEGGDSITKLSIINGVIKEKDIEL